MFSIGTFSNINKITTKTLRHYDEIGLLKPEFVDPFTGYRYYTSDQLPRLHKIITLKQMGLALNDIKASLNNPESLELFLKLKEQDILNQIGEEQSKLMQIRSYFNLMKGAEFSMYTTVIKPLPEVIVASMRQIVPSYDTFFDLCPNVMAKEMENVGCVCAVPEYCFNIYHDGEYKEHDIDVEICEAISEMKKDTEILKFKVIPEVPLAACALHKGPYETLRDAYSYIFKWIEENQYDILDFPRESFIDGIWNKESNEDWLTEIQVPVKVKV
ncbi:MAG: MerR family transcriptional regulator [Firmicutes bacterium HGW-Firmicutes-1]|jgi:DNA-binding transcriptional MerR regulator/predicted transcriptional regulator YdeE|nr:MAG: MerR family transcriptional regulator [Firmicutes bacterium HGW-Firmicutes-1]